MALTGKPSVIEPRPALGGDDSAALRPLQATVASIRERFRLIEVEINALLLRIASAEDEAATVDVGDLQSQIDALRSRIEILEAESPTEWYVNDVLIGIRNRVNFRDGGNVRVSGSDDSTDEQVIITFDTVTAIDIVRGILIMRGAEIELAGAESALTVERGSLALRGREIILGGTDLVLLDVQRGRLSLRGREVDVSIGTDVDLAVDRGRLRVAGRDVTLDIGGIFFRDFSDLTTDDLTAYKCTLDASSGNLVATTASGAQHGRVYFDLLPPGSPQTISGAFDITMTIAYSASSPRLNAIAWFTQGDSNADGTLQNGYWADVTEQLASARFIRFVSGSAVQIDAGSGLPSAGTMTVRLTHDGAGNYECFVNGVSKWQASDTTFTSGRIGAVFFSNPAGACDPLVSFEASYAT